LARIDRGKDGLKAHRSYSIAAVALEKQIHALSVIQQLERDEECVEEERSRDEDQRAHDEKKAP
jgi:hypothetical protein